MTTIIAQKEVAIYVTQRGKRPFIEWLESLKELPYKERLDRVSLGNLGDHKTVGHGVSELRLKFGAGYRIYFGEDGDSIILLLSGGDKTTQSRDIKKAQEYWRDYLKR